ncbi:MAG TPA: serine/threonine-protein kinase [Acidimicrobiales bacterium]
MQSVGGYELELQIGAGASGTVWRAFRAGPVTQVVALKRLRVGGDASDVDRIRREAAVLTELDHPHIVRVHEVLDDGDGLAVAMQYASGGSLQALLAERGRLAPGEVVALAAPIAEALASAHRRGILHGDVKPANILFTSDGEPLLGDFGVARTLGARTSDNVAGTAEYVAPELLDGADPDPRADVYSLAVVCYEALAGQPPYRGAAPLAVARAAADGFHDPLAGLADMPAALATAVETAMDRDPSRRFPSADDFAQALRTAVATSDARLPGIVQAPPGVGDDDIARGTRTFGPRPPRPDKKPPERFRLGAAFFVLLALAGVLYLVRGPLRRDAASRCPQVEAPIVEPGGQVVAGDPEGDGCTSYGVYQQTTMPDGQTVMLLTMRLEGEPQQIIVGIPGDQLFLGDWDCDDIDTPALYARTAGQIEYYNAWPQEAGQRNTPTKTEPAPPNATATIDQGSNGCDTIVVQ